MLFVQFKKILKRIVLLLEIFFAFILAEKPKRLAEKPIFDPSAFGFGTISTLVTFNNFLTIANDKVSKNRYGYIDGSRAVYRVSLSYST